MDDILTYYQEREQQTAELVEETLDDTEEEDENPSKISWFNLQHDENKCKIITGFTPEEFLVLFDMVSADIDENVGKGRGRKTKISKQDKLLMVFCYLKHYETVDEIGKTFSISKTHIYHILHNTINAIVP